MQVYYTLCWFVDMDVKIVTVDEKGILGVGLALEHIPAVICLLQKWIIAGGAFLHQWHPPAVWIITWKRQKPWRLFMSLSISIQISTNPHFFLLSNLPKLWIFQQVAIPTLLFTQKYNPVSISCIPGLFSFSFVCTKVIKVCPGAGWSSLPMQLQKTKKTREDCTGLTHCFLYPLVLGNPLLSSNS